MYGRDIADDLIRDQRPWRWFWVRLLGLTARDTDAASLMHAVAEAPLPVGSKRAAAQRVGDVLEMWARSPRKG